MSGSINIIPAFSFSKRFIEPVLPCLEVPPELIKLAQRRVEEKGDIHHERVGQISWGSLGRVLAIQQRFSNTPAELAKSYFSDDVVNTFIRMVCDKMNGEHYTAGVLRSSGVVDLTDHNIRYISIHSSAWTALFNRLISKDAANRIDENEYRTQAWRHLQRQGIRSEDFDDLRLLNTIFLPLCSKNHWTLGFIQPTKRRYGLLNSLSSGEASTNAERRRQQFVNFVKRHLTILANGRVNFDQEGWKEVTWPESGEQRNGADCGAFVCLNAVAMARDKGPYMALTNLMPGVRYGIAATLVHGSFTDGLLEM